MMRALTPFIAAMGLCGAAAAQDYRPDILEMNGTFALQYAPDDAFTISDGGTIEFWTQPDWTEDPGFDPVILSNLGADAPAYIIAMTGDRQALTVVSGADEDLFTFDFSDGKLHHVALNHYDDGFIVLIDGQVAGESDMILDAGPSYGLWVGSVDGEANPYYGAIAALRFWDYVPDRDILLAYARRDVMNPEHPDIGQLSAISDFENRGILIVEEIE